ncbi:hypothetical protein N431DRAFT_400597 [Stipitochalara longipes BDJ]|nr:hypothetical protein N431DRAFT_400597 [Stipitochalara longipes BDJ]
MASSTKNNILIMGATGPLGLLTAKEALSHSFKITLFVRSPEKLPQEIKENPKVTTIVGQLTETAKLFPLLPSFSHIVSVLGPQAMNQKGKAISEFYAILLQELSSLTISQRPYILALSTPSQDAPQDTFSLPIYLMTTIFKRIGSGAYSEIRAITTSFKKYGDGIQWTLYRVGVLTDTEGKGYATAGWVGDERWKLSTSRGDIARWLIREVECDEDQRKWVGLMPALSGL